MIRGSNKSNFNCARGYRIKSSSSRQMAPSGKIKCWRRPLGDTFSNTWCNINNLYSTYTLALILEINNQAGNFESKHKWWSKTTRKSSHKTSTKKKLFSNLLKKYLYSNILGPGDNVVFHSKRQGLCQGHCHVCIRE